MDIGDQEILESAISDGRSAVVSVTHGDLSHSFIAQFLDREEDGFSFQTTFWPEGLSGADGGLKVSFQFGIIEAAAQFDAEVRRVEMNPQLVVVRCADPHEIRVTQRRTSFRAPVPSDSSLSVTIWKIPPHWVLRDRPKPSTQVRAELIDLSSGGMCLKVFPQTTCADASADAKRLRTEIRFNGEDAVLDGQIVYRSDRRPDGSIRIGVAFRKLDNSIEGRRGASLLNRAIAALQRQTIKQIVNASV